jgi:hypothetical protein
MARPPLGLLVLVHQRHQLIPLIVEQVAATWPGAVVHFTMDRPSEAVLAAVEQEVGCYHAHAPFPALTHKEQFIELRDWQLRKMNELDNPEWCAMWDDDVLFEDPAEAKAAMDGGQYDLLYSRKRFLWETPDQENIGLPTHNSIQLFRNVPYQRWTKMVQAPSPIADCGLPGQLVGDMLDVGFLTKADRERVFKAYARTPKLADPYTAGLVDSAPRLAPFKSNSVWHQRIKQAYDLSK